MATALRDNWPKYLTYRLAMLRFVDSQTVTPQTREICYLNTNRWYSWREEEPKERRITRARMITCVHGPVRDYFVAFLTYFAWYFNQLYEYNWILSHDTFISRGVFEWSILSFNRPCLWWQLGNSNKVYNTQLCSSICISFTFMGTVRMVRGMLLLLNHKTCKW